MATAALLSGLVVSAGVPQRARTERANDPFGNTAGFRAVDTRIPVPQVFSQALVARVVEESEVETMRGDMSGKRRRDGEGGRTLKEALSGGGEISGVTEFVRNRGRGVLNGDHEAITDEEEGDELPQYFDKGRMYGSILVRAVAEAVRVKVWEKPVQSKKRNRNFRYRDGEAERKNSDRGLFVREAEKVLRDKDNLPSLKRRTREDRRAYWNSLQETGKSWQEAGGNEGLYGMRDNGAAAVLKRAVLTAVGNVKRPKEIWRRRAKLRKEGEREFVLMDDPKQRDIDLRAGWELRNPNYGLLADERSAFLAYERREMAEEKKRREEEVMWQQKEAEIMKLQEGRPMDEEKMYLQLAEEERRGVEIALVTESLGEAISRSLDHGKAKIDLRFTGDVADAAGDLTFQVKISVGTEVQL